MRIVLVHPAGSNWVPGKRDISATANRMAPIGILSIAAFLEARGHEVFVHDCLGPAAPRGREANAAAVLERKPDMVGFSATTSAFLDGWELARRIKRTRPEIITVFGGVHVSSMGAALMEDFEDIDFLCIGEGEATMAELADGKTPADIDGLVWKNNGRPATNRPREHIADLDSLPFPSYEKLRGFPGGYRLPLFSYIHEPGATMITSRGCPYQCSYCDRSVFKRGYRYNSAERVYEHMRRLGVDFGVRHINIYDDLFTTHRGRITALCEMLIRKPLGMRFNCAVRVGHADDELLKMLKEAGFLQLSVGIETGNSDLMAVHKPGVKLEEARKTVKRIQAHGLRAKGLFMMGLPGETVESIRQTSEFVLSLGLDDMNMSKFTPFPGAPVWSTIRETGDLEDDWPRMNCLNFVYLPKDVDSRKTLDELYNRHVKGFYESPTWRKKFLRRLWSHRWSLWRLIRHMPSFAAAMRTFEPGKDADGA